MEENDFCFIGKIIRKNDTILWVKDSCGTFVFDQKNKTYWILSGFEESLWHLLCLQNPILGIIELIERTFSISKDASFRLLEKQLILWNEQGIIQII